MGISKEEIKKYLPFIVVGGVAGVVGLLMKPKNGSVTTSIPSPINGVSGSSEVTQSNQNGLNDLATQTKNSMTDLADQTNEALDTQKTYFEKLMEIMKTQLENSNTSISTITSELHSTNEAIRQGQIDTNNSIRMGQIEMNKLISMSANPMNDIQSSGVTNPSIFYSQPTYPVAPQQYYENEEAKTVYKVDNTPYTMAHSEEYKYLGTTIGKQFYSNAQINDPSYEEEIRKAVVSGKEISNNYGYK